MKLTETQKARAWDELNDFVSHLQKMKTLFDFEGSVAEVESLIDVTKKIKRKVTRETADDNT